MFDACACQEAAMTSHDEVDFGVAQYEYESEEAELLASKYPIIDASANTFKSLSCLSSEGVDTIIRYYCGDPNGAWKVVKPSEAKSIVDAGLKLCIVYEASAKASYFSHASGKLDGEFACRYGSLSIGQPKGSAIYFAVDFDADDETIRNRIIPYFHGVRAEVAAAGSPYRIGVYGSGLTCATLLDQKLVDLAWLAQSTGWRKYEAFKTSRRWTLLQKPTTHVCGIEVDFDEASVADFGAFGQLDVNAATTDEGDFFDAVRAIPALDGLDEGFKAKAVLLIKECAKQGIKMVPYFGLRSPREQAKLWRQSRSAPEIAAGVEKLRDGGAPWLANVLQSTPASSDKHVTNALPGMSWHQWGEALDCYRDIGGKPNWDPKNYAEYANIAEMAAIGLTAGGHWPNLKDWPHVQLRPQAGPQSLYSYATIDARMKEMWGGTSFDMVATSSSQNADEDERTAKLVSSIVSVLSEAARTEIKIAGDQRPYFFPNGIFKIDVAVGILAEPPSGTTAALTPGISGRVVISGSDKA
jgi:peptidoglycan LD-endopeptidase CwlK